ncbi:MAG: ArsR family transcriptional regulator [Nanoarchaeota archaeon]
MVQKSRIKEITITEDRGTFASFFKKIAGEKDSLDFRGLEALRSLLSNEKARIIHVIKARNPKSIYHVAKLLNRDFKSVSDDIKVLEEFGLIDLIKESTGKRSRLRPVVIIDLLKIDLVL